MNMKCWFALLPLLALMAGCGPKEPILHSEDAIPEQLSEWGVLYQEGDRLRWSESVAVYDLSSPLFTDYAHKLRTVYLPEGGQINEEDGWLRYPIGTIFSKTFYYPSGREGRVVKAAFREQEIRDGLDLKQHRVLETRLLVRYESGWKAISYVWDEQQRSAQRKITGALFPLRLEDDGGEVQDFTYVVPDANQCQGCHATAFNTRQAMPIGPARPDFVNRESPLGHGNQLAQWEQLGWLDAKKEGEWPAAPDWENTELPLADRARAYLDINCAHCHSATGAADTSGLWLDRHVGLGARLGLCKAPIAAGQGTGGRRWGIDPGEPDNSILVYRMESLDPGAMMPELGRSLVHDEGVALVREWIAQMNDECRTRLSVTASLANGSL